jgi:hypothetical protein
MIARLIFLFFISNVPVVMAQNRITTATDTVIYYNQNQEYYYFDLEGKKQEFFFDSVIYDNYRPITVFIKNNTPNVISIYPRYHANTFWKHSPQLLIEPNAYFKAKLIISETEKFKRIGLFTGFLKIEYWDTTKLNHKKFELILSGKVGLGNLPPFKADTFVKIIVDGRRTYSDTLPYPIPDIYDSIPFQEDKIWIDGNFYTQNGAMNTTWVNRKVFVDGSVLEYYQDGKLYSKRSKLDSSDLHPYFISYYQNGKVWIEQFISQTIEYTETGKKKSVIKDDVKTVFFDNAKIASIEDLRRKGNIDSPYLTLYYYKTGCKVKEVFNHNGSIEGQTTINYRENICDCPKSKINNIIGIYYKKCDLTVDTIITHDYPSIKIGEFDAQLNLISGKEEIGSVLGSKRTYSLQKVNSQYTIEFKFRRFTEINKPKYRDSIFVITFNRVKNDKKEGVWLNSNLSTDEFVWQLKEFESKNRLSEKVYNKFVYFFPWEVYEDGNLTETQYYSKKGDLIKNVKYLGEDSTIINYEYKLLHLDSNIVTIDSISYYGEINLNTVLIYENNLLRQKTSPQFKSEYYNSVPKAISLNTDGQIKQTMGVHDSGVQSVPLPFTVEKGQFENLKLYNGTIEYYDKNAKLIKIATVINGK